VATKKVLPKATAKKPVDQNYSRSVVFPINRFDSKPKESSRYCLTEVCGQRTIDKRMGIHFFWNAEAMGDQDALTKTKELLGD
jgi:hypothetical protein